MGKPLKLEKGNNWAKCLCAEIDPSDRPCIVCEIWQEHKQTPPSEVGALFGEVPEKADHIGRALRDGGFDDSSYDSTEESWTVGCSQCLAAVINGMPTHEHGCPNKRKAQEYNADKARRAW